MSARQREHKKDLTTFVDRLASTTGSFPDLGVDPTVILKRAVATLAAGNDDDPGYYRAARSALLDVHDGHVDLFSPSRCGTPDLPELFTSLVGACTQPYQDHAIVSFVAPGNPLGLAPGDRITKVDDRSGAPMIEEALTHAFCGVGSSSASNRRFAGATSLLATVRVGTRLEVVHPDGSTETKTVERLTAPIECRFPAAGAHAYPAKTTLRRDGVAVITVPTFLLPTSPALTEEQVKEAIGAEFDKARDAKAIIWDVRGNPGGATFIALSIVAGMPGFARGTLARCAERTPGVLPFAERAGSAFAFQMAADSRFAFHGKVAVLIDGLTTSAGDYFALAASTMTGKKVALVGAPTSGAYGGVSQGYEFGATAPLRFTSDVVRCTDPHGTPLERTAVEPTLRVELEPADLVAGRDTVIESAAALLLQ